MAWCAQCGTKLHEGSRYCMECQRLLEPSEVKRTPPWLQKLAAVGAGIAILALSALGDLLDGVLGEDWSRSLVIVIVIVLGALILLAALRGRLEAGSRELSGPAPRDDAWHTRDEEADWEEGASWWEESEPSEEDETYPGGS